MNGVFVDGVDRQLQPGGSTRQFTPAGQLAGTGQALRTMPQPFMPQPVGFTS